MLKALKDPALALIKATLILLALCPFLTLLAVNRANDIPDTSTAPASPVSKRGWVRLLPGCTGCGSQ